MDSNTQARYNLLSTGRGAELRGLMQSMTCHPSDLPPRSYLNEQLAEIYPGDGHAALRKAIFDKLIAVAEARAKLKQATDARASGMSDEDVRAKYGGVPDLLELRGLCDEYVVQVERGLADADRILPAESANDDVDAAAVAEAVEGARRFDGPRVRPLVGDQINGAVYRPAGM